MARWGSFLLLLSLVISVKPSHGMGLCEFEDKFPGSSESCFKSNTKSVSSKPDMNSPTESPTTDADQRTSEEIHTTDHQPSTGVTTKLTKDIPTTEGATTDSNGRTSAGIHTTDIQRSTDGIFWCLVDGALVGPDGCTCDDSTNPPTEECQSLGPRVNLSISKQNKEGISNWTSGCMEINTKCGPSATSGIYLIKPTGVEEPFPVYCNNSIDGGGWTVFQRRVDGSVDFYRTWNDYRHGFGFLHGDFWLGNDKTHLLTQQEDYELRIDMNDKYGNPYYANYALFRIGDEGINYTLTELGLFSGTAQYDRLHNNVGFAFSTWDQANDPVSTINQAELCHGAWWYNTISCSNVDHDIANLNGLFNATGQPGYKSIYWDDLNGDINGIQTNLKYTEMKVRPLA